MVEQLEGKVAIVTGGASGIGKASALTFAKKGVKVVVADIDVEGGEATVRAIKENGNEAIFVKTDVSKAADVETVVKETVKAYGQVNFAHNNAGVGGIRGVSPAPTADTPEDSWDYTINVNLKGVWLCMKYEIPQMLIQGHGSIVNTSSMLGLVGFRAGSAYVASKHAVIGLTKTAALEYAPAGIRINAVCPGFIPTPMAGRLLEHFSRDNPKAGEEITAAHPVGRLGTPEEVAEAVVWLCSDASSFVTGHTMVMDGGYTAQ